MNYNEFFLSLQETDLKVTLENNLEKNYRSLSNEALFQLPLISLIILLMAKSRIKPKITEIGQLVGEVVEDSMVAFKKSSQHIRWSANLRIRTVKAVNFLEHAGLIILDEYKKRIDTTPLGKKLIEKALKLNNNLKFNLLRIERSYRNLCVSKKLSLELE